MGLSPYQTTIDPFQQHLYNVLKCDYCNPVILNIFELIVLIHCYFNVAIYNMI